MLVLNIPLTYPPEAVNRIMVSGYMTPSSDVDFTYPTTFKEELFRIVPDYQIDLGLRQFWGNMTRETFIASLRQRIDCLKALALKSTVSMDEMYEAISKLWTYENLLRESYR